MRTTPARSLATYVQIARLVAGSFVVRHPGGGGRVRRCARARACRSLDRRSPRFVDRGSSFVGFVASRPLGPHAGRSRLRGCIPPSAEARGGRPAHARALTDPNRAISLSDDPPMTHLWRAACDTRASCRRSRFSFCCVFGSVLSHGSSCSNLMFSQLYHSSSSLARLSRRAELTTSAPPPASLRLLTPSTSPVPAGEVPPTCRPPLSMTRFAPSKLSRHGPAGVHRSQPAAASRTEIRRRCESADRDHRALARRRPQDRPSAASTT